MPIGDLFSQILSCYKVLKMFPRFIFWGSYLQGRWKGELDSPNGSLNIEVIFSPSSLLEFNAFCYYVSTSNEDILMSDTRGLDELLPINDSKKLWLPFKNSSLKLKFQRCIHLVRNKEVFEPAKEQARYDWFFSAATFGILSQTKITVKILKEKVDEAEFCFIGTLRKK